MFNLFSFYRSQEWRKLLEQLKIERLTDDGEIICERCGRPITRAYDIIGHHKIELTEQNVNNLSISLNPENIAFLHHRCHNYEHNKLGYSVREVYLVYGAPFAGKHEYVQDCMNEGDLIVDINDIWQCVSGCDRFVKPNRLRSVVFKVRDELITAVRYRAGKWCNAYVIGGYPLSSERTRLCKELGAREVFIESDREACIERLKSKNLPDEKDWIGFIDGWFASYTPPLQD